MPPPKPPPVPTIVAVSTVLPPHYYDQEDLLRALRRLWADQVYNPARLEAFHRNLQIQGRYLALPQQRYFELAGFDESNREFIRVALELGEAAVAQVLNTAGLAPADLALLASTTVTGLAVPSLEARLMNRLPFSAALKRLPLFGLGCLAGAAGVARVNDYLVGHPQEAALLLAVELCSLTLQSQDLSIPNLVSSGLFGDGAAAVLMVGDEHPLADRGPRVCDSRSVFFPNSESVMGWDIGSTGFSIVLSPQVPEYARDHLPPAILDFLAGHALSSADIKAWVAHPGGPKVIDALEEGLQLAPGSLDPTRRSLHEVGNLSSASVLFVLADTLTAPPPPGSWGLMLAMGPAFCAEAVLLRW